MRKVFLIALIVFGAASLAACQNSPDWTVGQRQLGPGFKIPH